MMSDESPYFGHEAKTVAEAQARHEEWRKRYAEEEAKLQGRTDRPDWDSVQAFIAVARAMDRSEFQIQLLELQQRVERLESSGTFGG